MLASASLALAILGVLASVLIHGAAWLGLPAPFQVTFALFLGCLLVWWQALTAAWAAFKVREVKPLWEAVTRRCSWLTYCYQALTYYFMVYWLSVLYVQFVTRAKPSPELWARFYSAGALVFYVVAAAFLWAARNSGSRPAGA